jgi:hypothetical protein
MAPTLDLPGCGFSCLSVLALAPLSQFSIFGMALSVESGLLPVFICFWVVGLSDWHCCGVGQFYRGRRKKGP